MRDLILVGLGHAHRHLLTRLTELSPAFRVTVVAPHDGRYGGATAAMLSGRIPGECLRWAPPTGVEIVTSRAVGCESIHRRLWLADGRTLRYDRLSLNTGTRRLPAWATRPGSGEPRVWSGHSVTQLVALRAALDADAYHSAIIAGGSPEALEIAGGLSAREQRAGGARVTLLWPSVEADRVTRAAFQRLAGLGVDVVIGAVASALAAGGLRCVDGRRFAADHVVWAGPAEPDALTWALGLPVGGPGLQVDARLECPQARSIHAAGAAAALDGRRVLPGWDGERQARVMWSRLRAESGTHALKRYAPPIGVMSLDLGPAGGVVAGTRLLGSWAGRCRRRAQRRWLDIPV